MNGIHHATTHLLLPQMKRFHKGLELLLKVKILRENLMQQLYRRLYRRHATAGW